MIVNSHKIDNDLCSFLSSIANEQNTVELISVIYAENITETEFCTIKKIEKYDINI